MKISRTLTILVALMSFAMTATAQNSTISPYSRYGYGLLNDNSTSMQRAMGGVGFAMASDRQVNVMNPASYATVDSLTFIFDMGVNLDMVNSKEGIVKEHSLTGGLDYITIAFPIGKHMGGSVGLLPYTSTGYSFSDSITNATTSHSGSGNINQAYIGLSVNPLKNLYVGFNFGYLFGHTVNDIFASTITGSTALFERYMEVKDWRLDIGLQYGINITPESRITLGFNYSPKKDLHGEAYGIYYDYALDTKPDTISKSNLKGLYSMPASYGAGINYQLRENLMVEADFLYQGWKDAKYGSIEGFESNQFDNRWKVALGGQYTPAPRGSYLRRMQYRLGAYYNHDYLNVRGNNVREYGVSMGFGLPITGFKSLLNLAFQYKHRQAHPSPLVKEDYFTISLGINFNEMWFRKAKIY